MIFYVYIGYLAAVNIAAFLAYILDFDFKRDAVKKGDETGAAVFSAAGGAPAIIFMSLTYRKSPRRGMLGQYILRRLFCIWR